jgi:myosin heavy subunit
MFGLITASVSFALSLLILRDFQRAIFTGLMGFVGSQAAVLLLTGAADGRLHQRQNELRQNIRSLQRKRAEAYESLLQLRREQEQLLAHPVAPQPSSNGGRLPQPANPWQPATQQPSHPIALKAQPLSWTLTESQPLPPDLELNGLETRVKTLSREEESLQVSLNQTRSAKQKADLHLTTSKAELTQLQTKIAAQEQQEQALATSMQAMEKQRQQLQQDLGALQNQVQTLEKSRSELTVFLQSSEPKRQQDQATQSLQTAIAQMQSQIGSLRDELGQLEDQIVQRRTEKQQLDQTLAQLQQQQASQNSQPPVATKTKDPTNSTAPQSIQPFTPKLNPPPKRSTSKEDLPTEWLSLKQALLSHELQALRSIALDANPGITLKRLAEENLTMPELLIDAINERALETIGDLILETGSDAGSTIIAQEYRDPVATLIAKYN